MSADQGVSPISAKLDDQGLRQRQLLRVKLSNCDAQLQNFAPIRDRMVASGGDPNKVYREIQSRRTALAADLRPGQKRLPTASMTRPVLPSPWNDVADLPIVPASLFGNVVGFGMSGFVQIGSATPAEEVKASGPGVMGEFITLAIESNGNVSTAAGLSATEHIPPDQNDGSVHS